MNILVIGKGRWTSGLVILFAILPACVTPRPVLAPTPGIYQCPVVVSISDSRSNAKIFYTTDGSTPTAASTPYAGPFPVAATDTVRAIAVAPNTKPSHAVHVEYTCALTRGNFAAFLQKQYNLSPPSQPLNFPDVPSSRPDYAAIQASAVFMNAQLLCPTCYLRPQFYPDEPIYRDISTLALLRILIANGKVQLLSAPDSAAVLAQVPDSKNLPLVSRPYFATAIKIGLLPLREGSPIRPSPLQTSHDTTATFDFVEKKFNLPPGAIPGAPQ